MSREKQFSSFFSRQTAEQNKQQIQTNEYIKRQKENPLWCHSDARLWLVFVYFFCMQPQNSSALFLETENPWWCRFDSRLWLSCVCVCAAQLAFCGELLDICMTLPYTDFLPPTFPIHIVIKVNIVKRWELCRLVLESWQVGCFVSLTCYHHIHFLPPTFTVHIVMKVNVVKQWCCVYW